MMNELLGELGEFCLVFQDDVLVFSKTFDTLYSPLNATRVSRANSRSILRLTCDIDREKLQKAQLEAGSSFYEKYASDEYVKVNNVLYKISGNKLLPVIPDSLIPSVISSFHDSVTSGHGGVERTLVKLSRSAYFESMKNLVAEYLRTCPICQRVKPDNRKPPGLMQSSLIGAPWETLYMDLMGPYVKSHPGGYKLLLVVIDDFTKWGEIFPLRDATAAALPIL
jgi:hypothetical protein